MPGLKKIIKQKLNLLWIFSFISSFGTISAIETQTIDIEPDSTQLNVLPFSQVLIDKQAQYELTDIQGPNSVDLNWQTPDKDRLFLGITESVVWVQFTVKNTSQKERSLYLQSEDRHTTKLTTWIFSKAKTQSHHFSSLAPFSDRVFAHSSFILPITVGAEQELSVIMRYKSNNPLPIGIELLSTDGLWNKLIPETGILWAYFGILGIMFIYNLFMYFSIRERAYIFYLLYVFCFAVISLSYTGLGRQYLWPDSSFFGEYTISSFTIGITLALYFFALEVATVPKKELKFVSLLDWAIIGFIVVNVLHMLSMETAWLSKAFFMSLLPMSVIGFSIMVHNSVTTDNQPGKMFILSFIVFYIGLGVITLRNVAVLPDNFITKFSVLFGAIAQITMTSFVLAGRINDMKRTMELANKKYRHIIDDSDELIFTLDKDGRFTSINKQANKLLRYDPKDMLGQPMADYILDSGDKQAQITKKLLNRALVQDSPATPLILPLRQRNGVEPAVMTIRLHHSEFEGEKEIIGIGAIREEDMFATFLQNEKQTYILNNYLSNAQLLSLRLTNNLFKFLEPAAIRQVQMGLREILINAIEHGNLGISFAEKSKSLKDETYFDLIRERRQTKPYRDRQVKVEYNLNYKRILIRVSDEGTGFDHKSFYDRALDNANEVLLEHGRGIWMTRQVFDRVAYNDQGNQVILVKNFNDRLPTNL